MPPSPEDTVRTNAEQNGRGVPQANGVWEFLTSSQLAVLRREAIEHVADARRDGRLDEPWEDALTALDGALDATEQVARATAADGLVPQQLGRRDWVSRSTQALGRIPQPRPQT